MESLWRLLVFTVFSCTLLMAQTGDPIGTGGPNTVIEGKDALLTCVVTTRYLNNTVIWRKGENEILSAGMNRVTKDKRIQVLHDDYLDLNTERDGDVWVLLIRNTKPSDSSVYICEVNTEPAIRSFKTLTVRTAMEKKSDGKDEVASLSDTGGSTQQLSHDFTNCCEAKNVTQKCIGFCNVHNIIDGTTQIEPEACEKDFPNIVKCMADGRNHTPCCEQKGIPDLCQDMCRGEYTPFTDHLRTRVSCIQHTLPGLQCILQGVQKLPSAPTNVFVETVTNTSLEIGWSPPEKLPETVKLYTINITTLHNFDPDELPNQSKIAPLNIPVGSDVNTYLVQDLKPFTMYSVSVIAHNENGDSLPSQRIRALTYSIDDVAPNRTIVVPKLPDVRSCCEKKGMSHVMCLDRMCDPKKTSSAILPDFMVCAPWSNVTFSCLANDVDHTPCCKVRGIPPDCLPLCTGNISTLNFSLFKCLRYMPDYSSCLLQGYGVLPGYPTRLRPLDVSTTLAILDWKAPKTRADTVVLYSFHFRELGADSDYFAIKKKAPPLVLEGLKSGTYYECYVTAINAHGRGLPSSRLVFRTKFQDDTDQGSSMYNITKCCEIAGLSPKCQPLCSYDMKLSDMQALSGSCHSHMATIIKCATGSRDHMPCCNRRGVVPSCMPLCRGMLPITDHNIISSECLSYSGNILQCLEEGVETIPGPVEDLRVTYATNTSIALDWGPPSDIPENSTLQFEYVVQYGKVDNMTMYETVIKLENEVHTNETSLELLSLEPFSIYRIVVIVSGIYGTSLPSSMLLVNTTDMDSFSSTSNLNGVPSPPHSLQVSSHSANWISITWQPPEFSHPHETITYKVFHKPTMSGNFSIIITRNLWVRLDKLNPNSQHIIYVQAVSPRGASLSSETLVAWTDPALPAFVEPPTVQPADFVPEGGSMTVLCLALGNPAPTVSLYIGGHLVRQDTTRHMVTAIHNVTTDMDQISCYADNGYGMPMQASKKIKISFGPKMQASGIVVANLGDSVDLKCTVQSIPEPKTVFWRDQDGRVPIIQGGNFDVSVKNSETDTSTYIMNLHIVNLQPSDVGDYFCHAENPLGAETRAVSVRIRNTPAVHNVSECCINQNVSSPCMVACSFYVDFEAVMDKPECIVDYDKLMKCAADGSDHRKCCADSHVPRKCLNWCRGESVLNVETCSLEYANTIIGCFETNREKLPGPPQNLVVNVKSGNQVKISWDPPAKNPTMVDGYRIFYHEVREADSMEQMANSSAVRRIDVKDTSVNIVDLKPDILYELVVKAGNIFGASILTNPVRFSTEQHESKAVTHSSTAGTISGIVAGVLAVIMAAVGLFFYKRRRADEKAANGVAFENPSYLRAVEQVQIVTTQSNNGTALAAGDGQTPSKNNDPVFENSGTPKKQYPAVLTGNPPYYEEIKFGQEGL